MSHYDKQIFDKNAEIKKRQSKKDMKDRVSLIGNYNKGNNTVDESLGFTYDNVDYPKHYNSHPSGISCIEITEHMSFCLGNAIKYIWRYAEKNGIEDLRKARWYLDREIAKLEKG